METRGSESEQRRARRAARNRAHIVDVGRRLMLDRGYYDVTVDEIADAADVSPASVYAIAGGKTGILRTLMAEWADAPELGAVARLPGCTSGTEVLQLLASASRAVREAHGDVMRIMLATAPHDRQIAEELQAATDRYRRALGAAAERLAEVGAVRPEEVAQTGDVLWFYFGYSGWFTLTGDLHWSIDRAEEWLTAQVAHLLRLDASA